MCSRGNLRKGWGGGGGGGGQGEGWGPGARGWEKGCGPREGWGVRGGLLARERMEAGGGMAKCLPRSVLIFRKRESPHTSTSKVPHYMCFYDLSGT